MARWRPPRAPSISHKAPRTGPWARSRPWPPSSPASWHSSADHGEGAPWRGLSPLVSDSWWSPGSTTGWPGARPFCGTSTGSSTWERCNSWGCCWRPGSSTAVTVWLPLRPPSREPLSARTSSGGPASPSSADR
ncbi:MAG TPA: hypothetical protein ENK43_12080 [Planctomycetes bacterium]|nr:hypothetical protein [Planctomycetota bacterium]